MDVNRLYIDSRDCVRGSPSDFEYQLSMDVTIPKETIAVLDTVLIPVSWYVVEKDVNDRIYVTEENVQVSVVVLRGIMMMYMLWLLILKKR